MEGPRQEGQQSQTNHWQTCLWLLVWISILLLVFFWSSRVLTEGCTWNQRGFKQYCHSVLQTASRTQCLWEDQRGRNIRMSLGWTHAPFPECVGQPHPGLRGSGQGGSSLMWSEEISLVSNENILPSLLRGECLKMCGKSLEQSFPINDWGPWEPPSWGRVDMWLHKGT